MKLRIIISGCLALTYFLLGIVLMLNDKTMNLPIFIIDFFIAPLVKITLAGKSDTLALLLLAVAFIGLWVFLFSMIELIKRMQKALRTGG